MMGSMRSMMLSDFKQPSNQRENNSSEKTNCSINTQNECNKEENKSDGDPADMKDIPDGYSDGGFELKKVRSESDANLISGHRFEARPNFMMSPRPNLAQLDIKSLIHEAKNGHNNLESVIQALVDKLKEKDDIITNLQGK